MCSACHLPLFTSRFCRSLYVSRSDWMLLHLALLYFSIFLGFFLTLWIQMSDSTQIMSWSLMSIGGSELILVMLNEILTCTKSKILSFLRCSLIGLTYDHIVVLKVSYTVLGLVSLVSLQCGLD